MIRANNADKDLAFAKKNSTSEKYSAHEDAKALAKRYKELNRDANAIMFLEFRHEFLTHASLTTEDSGFCMQLLYNLRIQFMTISFALV